MRTILTIIIAAALYCGCRQQEGDAAANETVATDTTLSTAAVTAAPWEGSYVTAGYPNPFWLKLVAAPPVDNQMRISVISSPVDGAPGCDFSAVAELRGDQAVMTTEVEGKSLQLMATLRGNTVELAAASPADIPLLEKFCSGGKTITGTYIRFFLIPEPVLFALNTAKTDIVPESKWLDKAYLGDYNNRVEEKIAYANEITTYGDFSGDGQIDYAVYLFDSTTQQVSLRVYHPQKNGFDSFTLNDLGTLGVKDGPRFVGSGLDTQPKGSTVNIVNGTNMTLQNDGIVEKVYEKTATLYFWDGAAYQRMIISD
jgi:hypothetical protein